MLMLCLLFTVYTNILLFTVYTNVNVVFVCYKDLDVLRGLLTEAVGKGYTGSEPCQELKATISEAEKCQEVALKISSSKHSSSSSSSSSSSFSCEDKMDVEELIKFLDQVESLPCKIPEAGTLQVRNILGESERESKVAILKLLRWVELDGEVKGQERGHFC